MDQKEFCLKWNSYSDVFQGTFAALLRNEHFTDVTLSCESQTIKCHRVVLSACSAYFETLLLDAAHPHPIVILKDVRYRDMQALVKFMYTGEVTVAQAQINSLIKVADLLKIKGLADPDESSNSVKADREPLPERLSSTPPPHKRKRGETEPENNLFQDPLQDVVPSSKRVNSVPLAVALEQSSSSSSTIQVQPEETSASPLLVKEEIGDFTLEGGDDSSSQYEDQGDEFDYGTDTLVAGESGGGEPGPSTGLNPSDLTSILQALRSNRHNLGLAVQAVLTGCIASVAARQFQVPTSTLHDALKKLGYKRRKEYRRSQTVTTVENFMDVMKVPTIIPTVPPQDFMTRIDSELIE